MTSLAAIIGILIAKAKTDGPRQKYGGEHYRHKISGTMHSASNGFYNHHLIKLYHNHCRKWQIILKEPQRGLSLVGVVSSSSRVELGDFAKVAGDGLTVLRQNFGGGVEEMRDFCYNIGIKENDIREYD